MFPSESGRAPRTFCCGSAILRVVPVAYSLFGRRIVRPSWSWTWNLPPRTVLFPRTRHSFHAASPDSIGRIVSFPLHEDGASEGEGLRLARVPGDPEHVPQHHREWHRGLRRVGARAWLVRPDELLPRDLPGARGRQALEGLLHFLSPPKPLT